MNFCIVVSSIVSKLSAAFMASNKSPSTSISPSQYASAKVFASGFNKTRLKAFVT